MAGGSGGRPGTRVATETAATTTSAASSTKRPMAREAMAARESLRAVNQDQKEKSTKAATRDAAEVCAAKAPA